MGGRVTARVKPDEPQSVFLSCDSAREGILKWSILMLSFVGLCGLIIDFGRGLVIRRQLQYATDSAALAAAQQMPDGDYTGSARLFSAGSSGLNAGSTLRLTFPTITLLAVGFLKSQGLPCSGRAQP